MKRTLAGQTVAVLVGRDPNTLVTTREAEITLTFAGVEGDHHAGMTRKADGRTPHYPRGLEIRNDRQLSVLSVEEMAAVAAELGIPVIEPEWLGANILVSGMAHLTQLPPATRLFFEQGVTLVVSNPNGPCLSAGAALQRANPQAAGLAARFVSAALGRRGLVCTVERPGVISTGEVVRAEVMEQVVYPE